MLAILVSLALLIVLTFRKINIVVVGIAAAAVMALLSGQPVVTAVTDTYMTGAAQFVRDNFLLFFFSVLFGKVMEETVAAASIAKFLAELLGEKFAILGVIFSGAVLVYGGVTTLVVVFSLYPIALSLFKKANLPRYLLPGAIAGGCFTFACANFPGTPNLVNVIPTTYLGTNTMAAPLVGVITGIAVMLMGCVYFLWEASRARARGDCFVEDEATTQSLVKAASMVRLPSPIIAILPIVLILILLNVFKQHVVVAMLGGILLCVVLFFRNVHGVLDMFSYSAENSDIAIINTAVVVGFGSVVQASQGFQKLLDFATSLENIPPLLAFGLMTTILAGACGSGSGGLGIALSAMADKYISLGLAPEILHRVGSAASVGLDSLPHNGAVITLLTICGQSHKESYKYIFFPTVVFTLAGMFLSIALGTVLYPIS